MRSVCIGFVAALFLLPSSALTQITTGTVTDGSPIQPEVLFREHAWC